MAKAKRGQKTLFPRGKLYRYKKGYQSQRLHLTMPSPLMTSLARASLAGGIAIPQTARLCYGSQGGTPDAFLLASPGRERTGMTETTRTMEPGLSRRVREVAGGRSGLTVAVPPRAQPLIAPAPRSAMFFPLVVLVAVLPGLAALNSWDLTPPGPLWGLRALAVLDGLAIDQVPAATTIKPSGESAALRPFRFSPLFMPGWPRSV